MRGRQLLKIYEPEMDELGDIKRQNMWLGLENPVRGKLNEMSPQAEAGNTSFQLRSVPLF